MPFFVASESKYASDVCTFGYGYLIKTFTNKKCGYISDVCSFYGNLGVMLLN